MTSKLPIDTIQNDKKVLYDTVFKEGYDIILANNDILEFLKNIPKNYVTLIVTSPPYNIGKPYETRKELHEYLEWQKKVIGKCKNILKDGEGCCSTGGVGS